MVFITLLHGVLWLQLVIIIIIIHSSGPLFTTEVEPFVVAASDHTCTKIKRSNFFSVTEEQFYEEVISSFTSEGDYILTNNTSPCKLLSMQHKIAFVMQNNLYYNDTDALMKCQ